MVKFLLIIIGLALIYWPGFTARFFQDDWLILELIKSGQWVSTTVGNVFRPVALHGFYGLGLLLFGSNPVGYHTMLFLVFVLTLYFIYKCSDLFTVFLYAFNVSLFAFFYWIATSYFVLAGFFIFASIYFATIGRGLVALLLFLSGLLSNELAIVEIGLLIIIKKFKYAGLFSTLGIPYMIWRYLAFSMPSASDYKLDLSLKFFSTLRWYLLRALNLPEGIQNGNNTIIFILLILLLLLIVLNLKNIKIKDVIFAGCWFLIGAAPFYFLPNHMSAYYISIALFGPMLFLSKILKKYRGLFAATYLLMTLFGLRFLSQTHWIITKPTL